MDSILSYCICGGNCDISKVNTSGVTFKDIREIIRTYKTKLLIRLAIEKQDYEFLCDIITVKSRIYSQGVTRGLVKNVLQYATDDNYIQVIGALREFIDTGRIYCYGGTHNIRYLFKMEKTPEEAFDEYYSFIKGSSTFSDETIGEYCLEFLAAGVTMEYMIANATDARFVRWLSYTDI